VAHKASKMIRVTAIVKNYEILDVMITGNLFAIPEDSIRRMELELRGLRLTREDLDSIMQSRLKNLQVPCLTMKDFIDAIMKIRNYI